MARRAYAISPKHLQQRQPQDLGIQPRTPMIHVPHVQFELLFPRKAVASIDLHPPGNTRPHLMTTSLERGVSRQVFEEQRPRADQTHRSEEHTSELQSPCNLVCRLLLEKKKNLQHILSFQPSLYYIYIHTLAVNTY